MGCILGSFWKNRLMEKGKDLIYEFRNPMPVITALGEGMAIYVRDGGTFENDVWCIVLNDGNLRHMRIDQIKLYPNATFDIGNGEKK